MAGVGSKGVNEMWKNAGLLLMASMVSGCAAGRIADLRDCGRLSVGIGPGLDVAAKVGCVAHPSLGIASRTYRIGLETRARYGAWEEEQVVWPAELVMQALGFAWGGSGTPLASYERFRRPEQLNDPEVATSWLPVLCSGRSPDPLAFQELTDVEICGTLAFVSIKAGINPLEILDFLMGCVGLDIGRDDKLLEK